MARAFLTGVTGFVGGHLARHLLDSGWQVSALAGRRERALGIEDIASRITLFDCDGSISGLAVALSESRPDVVFHQAALVITEHRPEDVGPLLASNVVLGSQLVEAMLACGQRNLINTGTSWQHFHQPTFHPVNLYAATKQAFEDILFFYHQAHGISVINLKLYDVFGPGDRRPKLINLLLEAARTGEFISVSPGDQEMDLLHVDDVTSAYLKAAELLMNSPNPIWAEYFVSGTRLQVKELVDRVSRAIGRPVHARWGGRPYREREVMEPVSAEGRTLPGWRPMVDLDAALVDLFKSERPYCGE